MSLPTAQSISCTALPVPPCPDGTAAPLPRTLELPHHSRLQNCGLCTCANAMYSTHGALPLPPPLAPPAAIQKGTRVLISLWDSLMFGRVPKNGAHSEISTRVPFCNTQAQLDGPRYPPPRKPASDSTPSVALPNARMLLSFHFHPCREKFGMSFMGWPVLALCVPCRRMSRVCALAGTQVP